MLLSGITTTKKDHIATLFTLNMTSENASFHPAFKNRVECISCVLVVNSLLQEEIEWGRKGSLYKSFLSKF